MENPPFLLFSTLPPNRFPQIYSQHSRLQGTPLFPTPFLVLWPLLNLHESACSFLAVSLSRRRLDGSLAQCLLHRGPSLGKTSVKWNSLGAHCMRGTVLSTERASFPLILEQNPHCRKADTVALYQDLTQMAPLPCDSPVP